MARLGVLVTSLPMSLLTLYRSPLRTQGVVSVAFSQSGRSPDPITPTRVLRDTGARAVAFVNDAQSPLAKRPNGCLTCRLGQTPLWLRPNRAWHSW